MSSREEIINTRVEINGLQNKKLKKANGNKTWFLK